MSLSDTAKSIILQKAATKRVTSKEHEELMDLALCFIRGEVSAMQCAKAMGMETAGGVYSKLGGVLISAGRRGEVIVIRKAKTLINAPAPILTSEPE